MQCNEYCHTELINIASTASQDEQPERRERARMLKKGCTMILQALEGVEVADCGVKQCNFP